MRSLGRDVGRWMSGLPRWVPVIAVAVVLLAAASAVVAVSRDSSGSSSAAESAEESGAPVGESEEARERAEGHGRATPGGGLTTEPAGAETAKKGNLQQANRLLHPRLLRLTRAPGVVFDVRTLKGPVVRRERPEHEDPVARESESAAAALHATASPSAIAAAAAPAPAPTASFEGLDFANWGAGHPPDTNGDVGLTYFIQTVNTSIGIYDKSNGNRVAAFTFNTFMSQGNFGNLCDTDNFGDPVVLYDSLEDRWVITDFAFKLDGSGNVSPQTAFQCFAVSKTGDPVNGGWNFYSILAPGGLGDYPKFGVWPDGIYMSANMFGYGAASSFVSPHVWALNKAQMYAGEPTVSVVDFAAPSTDFTLLPANARLEAGTPPAGTPEYFVATEEFLNGVTVYKLHVDWDKISTSTFTGPDIQLASTCWPNSAPPNAATTANPADVLAIRAMAQAQYSNLGGAESLWVDHTVRRGESATNTNCNAVTTGAASVRWYQLNVTGGTVAANMVQSTTWDPDAANTYSRFMPSLAVDRMGDMAIGYSKANSTTNPQIKYAGRLAGDPVNTFSQGEQTLIDGTGSQSGNCGSGACIRWGDYSGMALDPDGCTFWETNEYYQVTGLNDNTRIGAFRFPGCTTVGNGTLSGTVTDGSVPIAGAKITLGSRTATTDVTGAYSFTVPAGTYPSITAAKAGFDPGSASTLAVPDGGTLTRNFTLAASAASGCFTDNTQSTFQRGVPAGCDLTTNPGSVILANPTLQDAQNTTVSPTGFGFNNTSWAGQTFTPTISGKLTRVDVELFCSGCSGVNPDITVSIRATTGATPVPTGADLATATLTGFNDNASGGLKTVIFNTPLTVTAGTRYAFIFRANAARTGVYAYTCSCATTGFANSNPYANGQLVTSSTSGTSWAADTTVGGRDLNFVTYINNGFASSGAFVSSLKDANPAANRQATWTTLTFAATTPAGTGVKFQVAASNSSIGPFSYVGPDGTAATFFTTSGASLSQFNGFRYLRYKAILTTTDTTVTPALSSVQVCFADVLTSTPTTLVAAAATGAFGGTTTLSATLTAGGNGVPGKSVTFTVNGTSAGGGTTDANGVATVNSVSLVGIAAGSYPTGVVASFAGDVTYSPSTGSGSLTVSKANQTISVTIHAPGSAVNGSVFGVAATGGGSGNAVTFSSAGVCTNVGSSFTMTSGTGTCTVKYDQAGNASYNAAPQVTESVTALTSAVAPGAPTAVVASAGNGEATVRFVPPASDGGSVITSYTVTISPGGQTVSRYAGPIFVSGLTNGVSYTFTVTATNAIGTGPASSASAAVVPAPGAGRGIPVPPGTGPRTPPPIPPPAGTRPPPPGH